ncbi:MAG: YkvA family protein [Pseudomonadota bacterium]
MKAPKKTEIEAVLAPLEPAAQRAQEDEVKREFWSKFRTSAARLPFAEDIAAAYYCATDSKTPLTARGTLLAALAYFIMPLDMLPDVIAFLGFTDDFAVLTMAFSTLRQHITDEHREKAREAVEEAKEVA